jgi:hypothetical protein
MTLFIFLVSLTGCGPGVTTYPVKGKVIFKGGKPVTDGRVEFRPVSDATLVASGDIDGDGSFSLTTYKDGRTVAGAVEGQHNVIVQLERPAAVVVVSAKYLVQRGDNEFLIEVQRPKKR